ncbi:MAG: YopX family protein [Lactobacillus sp.]|nr:YopX family protein [Lactobacillus sp.]
MSREIKFRAWDKEDQVMDWPTEISWDDGGDIQNVDAYHKKMTNNFVLEQFTGLKDKNGKDIYEGDIVQYGNEEDMKFNVTFKQEIFYACNTLGSEFMVDTFLGSLAIGNRLKIIGNAHQNPELMETDK